MMQNIYAVLAIAAFTSRGKSMLALTAMSVVIVLVEKIRPGKRKRLTAD